MKQERWSGFDKFVVMADKHNGYIKSDYPAYLDFAVLKSVMEIVVKDMTQLIIITMERPST